MKTISDIRVYRSCVDNTDGNSLPEDFNNSRLNRVIHRIVMKLREKAFSFGEFDHLYINLTTCAVQNGFAPAKRSADKYHPWFRYYDAEVSKSLFDSLEAEQSIPPIVEIVEQMLLKFFSSPRFDAEAIHACFFEATSLGEKMLVKFKEKRSNEVTATVYLRYLDSGLYEPLLMVCGSDDKLIFEKQLPKSIVLDAFGEIRIAKKRVTILPRRNSYSKERKPMVFTI